MYRQSNLNKVKKNSEKEVTLEDMMIGATARGLGLDMFEEMNPGQIVDFCIAYNNYQLGEDETNNINYASQNDFDKF